MSGSESLPRKVELTCTHSKKVMPTTKSILHIATVCCYKNQPRSLAWLVLPAVISLTMLCTIEVICKLTVDSCKSLTYYNYEVIIK